MTQATDHPPMTAAEYRSACERLGLSPTYSAASALGISASMAGRYSRGMPIPMPVTLLLRALVALQDRREK